MSIIKSEAAALVEKWLSTNNDLQLCSSDRDNLTILPSDNISRANLPRDHVTSDYVTKLDWDSGQVGDNVHIILSGLRDTKIKLSSDHTHSHRPATTKRGDDPLISMQMRHEEVRKRRKDKDHAYKLALQEEQRQNDIRQRAWHLMKLEEEERKVREKREEEEVQKHIRAIRIQVKEQREKERVVKQLLEKEERDKAQQKSKAKKRKEDKIKKKLFEDSHSVITTKGEESIQRGVESKELVEMNHSQRDVTITRMTLMKQLIEAETQETKTNLKLLGGSFMSWYTLVQKRCAVRKRAIVIGNWRTLSRYWRAWRGVVRENKLQRIAIADAERLRKEKELLSLAEEHYMFRLLLKCVMRWRGVVSAAKIHNNQSKDRQQLIVSFLQTLTAQEEKENKEVTKSTTDDTQTKRSSSKGVWSTARAQLDKVLSEGRTAAKKSRESEIKGTNQSQTHTTCPHTHTTESQTHTTTHPDTHTAESQTHTTTHPDTHTTQTHTTMCPHTHTTQTQTHTTTCPHTHTTQTQTHTTSPQTHTTSTHTVITSNKTATKPLSLKKMEQRTALMAERKLAREERRRKREQEIKEELAAQEEARLKEERDAKMIEIQKRKEEKRIAQEKERERQKRLEIIATKTAQAKAHYQRHLLIKKGLNPWRKFVYQMREAKKKSDEFHVRQLTVKSFSVWMEIVKRKVVEKDQKAIEFHHRIILQHVFKAWLIYNEYCSCLMSFAVQMSHDLLIRKVFRSWERYTRRERISYWEKERRSRKHYENTLKVIAFSAWRAYVPLSHEEKQQEVRRAELRRKVAHWLPDYQPNITQN